MKFSVFTVGTPDYNFVETLDMLKKYGYQGVEWRVSQGLKEEPKPIPPKESWYWKYNKSTIDVDSIEDKAFGVKELCEKKGIEITALTSYLSVNEKAKVEKVIRAANIMDCNQIRVAVPEYNGSIPYQQLFNEMVQGIENLIPAAKEYGVRLNVEIHHNRIIPSCSAAYRLVSKFDPKYVGVIHDAGNMVREGFENLQMGLEILGEYLAYIHLKNARWHIKEMLQDGTNMWEGEWAPLSKGQVNLRELVRVLHRNGYNGYLSFEDFSNDQTTEEKLRDNILYMKRLLEEVK